MTDELTHLRTALAECQAREKLLRAELAYCLEDLQDWASYASEFFQDKHNLRGDIERYTTVIALPTDNSELRAVCLKVADRLYDNGPDGWDKFEAIVDEVIGKDMK